MLSFLLSIVILSIVLTFIIRYIWFFIVIKLYIRPFKNICIWKTALFTAFLLQTIDI
jgi:hypothetical protein